MIFEKVREIICEQFDVDEESVTLDTDIREDLDSNSGPSFIINLKFSEIVSIH